MDAEQTKQFLLELKSLTAEGLLTDGQYEGIQDKYMAEAARQPEASKRVAAYGRAVAALLSLGVAAVILAVIFLVAMSWTDMSSLTRIGVVGLFTGIAYVSAFLIFYRTRYKKTAAAVMVLASVLLPLFLSVIITEYEFSSALGTFGPGLFISAITTIASVCVAYLIRNRALALVYSLAVFSLYSFTILQLNESAAWLFGSVTSVLWTPFAAIALTAAYVHQRFRNSGYANILYAVGAVVLFIASMTAVFDSGHEYLWQAILLVECGLLVGLSIPLKSRVLLVLGIAFSIIYINQLYLTYFSDLIWWPVGLSTLGIILICAALIVERNRSKIKTLLGGWS